MVENFEGLGLSDAMVAAIRSGGLRRPTPVQQGAAAVLRRGGNVFLHAARGAGVVGAYGWALLDRLAEAEAATSPRLLVLVPLPEDADPTAESLARWAAAVGLRAATYDGGWPADADVLVTTPPPALEAMRRAELKLDGLQGLVLDGLSTMLALDMADVLETLLGAVPREAQRVIAAAASTAGVASFVERHARKALNVPPRQHDSAEPPTAATAAVGYVVVGSEGPGAALARLLGGLDGATVHLRESDAVEELAESLRNRGFQVEAADGGLRVGSGGASDMPISHGPPFDAATLAERHASGGVVVVAPREVPHLRQIAGTAGVRLEARDPGRAGRSDAAVTRLRTQIAGLIESGDLGAELLVLAPLIERYGAADVAAAAAALLRNRAATTVQGREAERAPTPGAPAPPAFVRLFFGIGNRDGIRPGDLLGAITGEAAVTGDQVGRIELKDSFSVVEVSSGVADKVIRALNGTSLRGRSLRVDYDRRGASGGAGPAGGGPRRGAPGPRGSRGAGGPGRPNR
jgi:ATP-dependent RNA helicase DeaD